MKKYYLIIFLMFIIVGAGILRPGQEAESAPVGPQIIIAQIKITSTGQFITLYNKTEMTVDLSTIQLEYFNSYDLLKATSGKLISLTGKVPAHGFAVVNDGPIQACYQMTVVSASLNMSATAGFVQVAHFLGNSSPQVVSILDDYVGWSKTAVTGAQTLPGGTNAFLQRQASDHSNNYQVISIPGSGSWLPVQQPDPSAACSPAAAAVASGGSALKTGSAPIPYTAITSPAALSSIPADDNGLAAPQISEVLPNPASPKSDESDEFIELYNSNDKAFDLSGFMLQAGTTTVHKYAFPAGTSLEPRKFSAFYSSDTNLSLSNSDGQVMLLDPGGNLLNKTDEYTGAKDDYAWVSAAGLWQWSTAPTPGAANKIVSPVAKSVKSSAATGVKTAVKGAKTTAETSSTPAGSLSSTPQATKMHPMILAGVGALALVYALYEYRHDMGNFFYKLRRHREAR